MPTTKVTSEELASLKNMDPKKIKPAFRWKHFGRIAELEAKLALDEKLKQLRKPVT